MDKTKTTPWVTRAQAAETLQVSMRTIDRMRLAGWLGWERDPVTGSVLISADSLARSKKDRERKARLKG